MIYVLLFIIWCSAEDLEEHSQPWVLESKQLYITQHPDAFNPSIVRWNGRLLLSFRVISNPKNYSSWIGLVWLNEQFEPVGIPYRLALGQLSRADDGRLITIDDQLFLVYSDNDDTMISKRGFRMHIVQLIYENNMFNVIKHEKIISFRDSHLNQREKNWVPFDYHGQLLLAYSINPHRILQPLFDTGHCEEFVETEQEIPWQWGQLRGGTPALLDGDHYLAFFHSSIPMRTVHSQGKEVTHYFVGAYTFSATPPFEIKAISAMPIIGRQWYHGKNYKPYWKEVQVVFPCGLLIENEYVYITYGRQDHEMWIAKLDKRKLYDSLLVVA